jgi:hypothetical protein
MRGVGKKIVVQADVGKKSGTLPEKSLKEKRAGTVVSQVIKHLPCKYEILSSSSNTTNKKINK